MENSKVIELLKEEVVDIEFTKKDGTRRIMTCTLMPEKLPKQIDVEEVALNTESLAVFDLINQGWRSFRWDSLEKVNGESFV